MDDVGGVELVFAVVVEEKKVPGVKGFFDLKIEGDLLCCLLGIPSLFRRIRFMVLFGLFLS